MEQLLFKRRKCLLTGAGQPEPVWNVTRPERQKKIAVVGISRGAGATFVALTLAFLLSESKKDESSQNRPAEVSYVEMRKPGSGESMAYYSAGLDRRFSAGRFTDFFSLYRKGSWPDKEGAVPLNLHKGINWVVWRNREDDDINPDSFSLDALPGKYIVADSPSLDILHKFDMVIGVINPLPSDVYAGAEVYEALHDMQICGLPMYWVLNRDNCEVNHSSLEQFLKLKNSFSVPEVSRELIYKAQYTCQLAAEVLRKEGSKWLEDFAGEIRERLD
jgi:hypothetical protein